MDLDAVVERALVRTIFAKLKRLERCCMGGGPSCIGPDRVAYLPSFRFKHIA